MSVIYGHKHFIPRMLRQSVSGAPPHIVNTSSAAGLISTPGMAAYNASKHAVVTLSETLYHELRDIKSNIGVSVLCPAFLPTNIGTSFRNRPRQSAQALQHTVKFPAEFAQVQSKYANRIMKAIAKGEISADMIADSVFAAIQSKQFYILPHQKIGAAVKIRAENIYGNESPTNFVLDK